MFAILKLILNNPTVLAYLKTCGQIISLIFIFYWLEKISPCEKHSVYSYVLNILYMLVTFALYFWLSPFITNYIVHFKAKYHIGLITLPLVGGILNQFLLSVLYAFVWDFFQYWMHRAEHMIPILWKIHKFHHSDFSLNASTAIRNNIPSLLVPYFFVFMPMQFIFNNLTMTTYASFVCFSFWGYFNHMNVKLNLKWLTPFFSGPQWHRIHHSIERKHYDKNFAAFFPILDIIFGTYYRPSKHEFPSSGIEE